MQTNIVVTHGDCAASGRRMGSVGEVYDRPYFVIKGRTGGHRPPLQTPFPTSGLVRGFIAGAEGEVDVFRVVVFDFNHRRLLAVLLMPGCDFVIARRKL